MATVGSTKEERLLTLEKYEQLPHDGSRSERVRGRIIRLNPPFPWHGFVCGKVDRIFGGFIEANDLGYALCNDSGVITERDPATVRGADFAFYSYQKVPRGTLRRRGYLRVVPDLIVEVKSPDDAWKEVRAKVNEYLKAGVAVVRVLDPKRSAATVYHADQPEQTLSADGILTFPQCCLVFPSRSGASSNEPRTG